MSVQCHQFTFLKRRCVALALPTLSLDEATCKSNKSRTEQSFWTSDEQKIVNVSKMLKIKLASVTRQIFTGNLAGGIFPTPRTKPSTNLLVPLNGRIHGALAPDVVRN